MHSLFDTGLNTYCCLLHIPDSRFPMPEALYKIVGALISTLAVLLSVPDEVPFLAQRCPAWCHRLNPRVRSALCQKRTPSSASETARVTGAVTWPVKPWDRAVEG